MLANTEDAGVQRAAAEWSSSSRARVEAQRQGAASRARPLTLHAGRFEVDQELHTHKYLRRRARGRRAESGRLAAMLVAASMPPRPALALRQQYWGEGCARLLRMLLRYACSSSTVRAYVGR